MKSVLIRAAAAIGFFLAASVPAAAAPGTLPGAIRVQSTISGDVFTDVAGRTLYLSTNVCDGRCASKWPPLLASADDRPTGRWTIVTRADGLGRQWAYDGRAAYRSNKDGKAGDVNGTAMGGVGQFRVAQVPFDAPAGIVVEKTSIGLVLLTSEGKTLYQFAGDKAKGRSSCEALCAETWAPVLAPALARPLGDWTVVRRNDGSQQWAHKGRPLYTRSEEAEPGSRNADPQWKAVVLRKPVPPPPGITVQVTATGARRLADARGMTLYVFVCNQRYEEGGAGDALARQELTCDDPDDDPKYRVRLCGDKCDTFWPPALAPSPVVAGDWTTKRRQDGTLQWVYKGRPVMTSSDDLKPGDANGSMSSFRLASFSSLSADDYGD